jgi:hypothetical protein
MMLCVKRPREPIDLDTLQAQSPHAPAFASPTLRYSSTRLDFFLLLLLLRVHRKLFDLGLNSEQEVSSE